ncbi:MAG: hypothetical protein JSR58_05950 [Verrucomicrobia bacterium]|nr:hypothetical protein [Verrucomicrobiota bacterium]
MHTILSTPISAIAMAARPAAPLIGFATAGYFLTDIIHKYFDVAREALGENDSWLNVGHMSKKGGLYLLETAIPIAAFIFLPLDPMGIAVRVGMATRGIFILTGKTPVAIALEKIEQMLPQELVALIKRIYNKYFGTQQVKLEAKEREKTYFDEPIKEKSIVEAVLNEPFVRIRSTDIVNPKITNEDGSSTVNKDMFLRQPKMAIGELQYLQEHATDSWSMAQVALEKKAKVDPFAAVRKMNRDMAEKNAAPKKEEKQSSTSDYEDVDGGSSYETSSEKNSFNVWFEIPVSQRTVKLPKPIQFPKEGKMARFEKEPTTKKKTFNVNKQVKSKPVVMKQTKTSTAFNKLAKTGIKILGRI